MLIFVAGDFLMHMLLQNTQQATVKAQYLSHDDNQPLIASSAVAQYALPPRFDEKVHKHGTHSYVLTSKGLSILNNSVKNVMNGSISICTRDYS
mmetsp:Transcript_24851/g.23874  ORF Transcript_24851/g.23874 Transcript_24851/m.23874 type:complete len:94 (-) Transcript_24851:78-359(-)